MSDKEHRELNYWIAKHVMGWKESNSDFYQWELADGSEIDEFNPTTDPAAAMEVLKKCGEKCKNSKGHSHDLIAVRVGVMNPGWTIFAQDGESGFAITETTSEAETIELAICLFAKKLFSK